MNVINGSFKVGERYVGIVNKEIFTVVDIKPAGTIVRGRFDVEWALEHDTVYFKCESTGRIFSHSLNATKYLMLQKLPEKTER